jgi:hypothetical protein
MDKIIVEVLEELKNYLNRFIPGVNEMIINYKNNNEEQALSTLPYAIEGLQWIMEVIDKTKIYFVEEIDNDIIKDLNKSYKDMIYALEKDDYSMFFHIMESDVLNFVSGIYNRLKYLKIG